MPDRQLSVSRADGRARRVVAVRWPVSCSIDARPSSDLADGRVGVGLDTQLPGRRLQGQAAVRGKFFPTLALLTEQRSPVDRAIGSRNVLHVSA
jgi:hypothetical protein